ncbi:MAG: glycoside hydrolase family 18 [Verrucomicrobiales bacterium]|nr:glycoside hydrolase family 18 [Verrucomicrobiales bacterium]
MRLLKPTIFFCCARIILVVLFFGCAIMAFGQEPTLVVPPIQPGTRDYSGLLSQTIRLQTVYGAGLFTNGTMGIYEIRFQRSPGTIPFANAEITIRISMSTTSFGPDALSTAFNSNTGPDEQVVFDGTIKLNSSAILGADSTTNPFDIAIPLTTPFYYDPARGNLLVEYSQTGGSIPAGVLAVNGAGDKGSRLFNSQIGSAGGSGDSLAEVVQFKIAPDDGNDLSFFPKGGGFTNSIQVHLFSKLGEGEIRYTLDGSIPNEASTLYTNFFKLTQTTTVKAGFFVNGFAASDVFSATFIKANPILFTPGSGYFTNSLQVILTNTLGSGIVRYTVDGTAPTSASPIYTGPIQLTDSRTISARLFLNNFGISDIYSTNYMRLYAFGSDGISAAWRQQYFGNGYQTNPLADANADPDFDGSSNAQEFNAGTNPLDAKSGYRIGIKFSPVLSWGSALNSRYNILKKTNLSTGQFTLIGTVTATNEVSSFVDISAGTDASQAFYSIELIP